MKGRIRQNDWRPRTTALSAASYIEQSGLQDDRCRPNSGNPAAAACVGSRQNPPLACASTYRNAADMAALRRGTGVLRERCFVHGESTGPFEFLNCGECGDAQVKSFPLPGAAFALSTSESGSIVPTPFGTHYQVLEGRWRESVNSTPICSPKRLQAHRPGTALSAWEYRRKHPPFVHNLKP